MNYEQHPLSAAFPAMQAEEYQSLYNSIAEIGVLNPITLYEGMVIDGWHRYKAAQDCGMACPVVELGDVDPRDFVLAQNKSRRSLTASQRAAAVTSVYRWAPAHRQGSSQKEGGTSALLIEAPTKTSAEMAAIAGVSKTTIKHAKLAHKAGLTDAVKEGVITVKEAAAIVSKKTVDVQESAEPEIEPEYTPLEAAHDQISDLQDALAVASMGEVPDVDKNMAHELIQSLRSEVTSLGASLEAVSLSRDLLMQEVAQLKKQCQMQRREIEKLKSNA